MKNSNLISKKKQTNQQFIASFACSECAKSQLERANNLTALTTDWKTTISELRGTQESLCVIPTTSATTTDAPAQPLATTTTTDSTENAAAPTCLGAIQVLAEKCGYSPTSTSPKIMDLVNNNKACLPDCANAIQSFSEAANSICGGNTLLLVSYLLTLQNFIHQHSLIN